MIPLCTDNHKERPIEYYVTPNYLISDTNKNHVPDLLQMFMEELVNNSLKRVSISQAIYAAASSSSIMPLQFGIAVTTDSQLSSKWLNELLSILRFASSYDEVSVLIRVF